MELEQKIIFLLVVAAGVAMLAYWRRLPYTVALVAAGLGLSVLHVEPGLHLNKELVFAVFLPALLFEAAFHLEAEHFKKNAGPILVLALVGVVVSILVCGGLVYLGLDRISVGEGLHIYVALLFGALISATDPISVIAIFKELGLPHRLNLVVEGESLFNDGTAVVMFSLLLVAVTGMDAHGASVEDFSAAWVAQNFATEVFGGLAVGLVFGLVLSFVTKQIEDHLIEIMLTTILAYGSYLFADHLHFSGVIAVVAAGMMSGNYGSRVGMSPRTRLAVTSFWEYTAFVVNSLIFLLIGMEVKISQLVTYKWHILIAWLSVLIARAVAVNLLLPVINRSFTPLPWKWSPVFVWGGLRGSLSMALALSLLSLAPETLEASAAGQNFLSHRDMLVAMTFGVVVLSILGQGLTMKPLLRLLGMLSPARRKEYEELQARIKSVHAAQEELEELRSSRSVSLAVYQKLRDEYEARLTADEAAFHELQQADTALHAEEESSSRLHLVSVEKEALRKAFSMGLISEEVMNKLINECDRRMDEMSSHEDKNGPGGGP